MSQTDPRLLLLSPDDNVLVARAPIAAGEPIRVEGLDLPAATAFSLGHKLARRPITAGDPIIKYGAVIGSATADRCPPVSSRVPLPGSVWQADRRALHASARHSVLMGTGIPLLCSNGIVQ